MDYLILVSLLFDTNAKLKYPFLNFQFNGGLHKKISKRRKRY